MDATEQAYLEKRKAARTGQDSNEQPEPVEAVDVLDDSAPIEDPLRHIMTIKNRNLPVGIPSK